MSWSEEYDLIVSLVVVPLILVFLLHMQFDGAVKNVEYSSFKFADTLKAQSAALHLLTHEKSSGFGEFTSSNFSEVKENCGIKEVSGIQNQKQPNIVSSNQTHPEVRLITKDSNCQSNSSASVILGLEIKGGGDSTVERAIIR